MFKWAEIASFPAQERNELLGNYLNDNDIPNEFHIVECDESNFSETLQQTMKDFDAIKVGSPFGERVIEEFKSGIPEETRRLGAADCLIKIGDRWWPRSSLFHGMHEILSHRGEDIDFEGSALIVGAGAAAKFCIAALLKIGFRKILIANKEWDRAEKLVQDLSRLHFGVDFQLISRDQLILLPGENSLIINTTPIAKDNEFLEELYYFNFLKENGMVWDLVLKPARTQLILEAEEIGIEVIKGFEIASWSDCYWVEWATGKEIDREDYNANLLSILFSPTFPKIDKTETKV